MLQLIQIIKNNKLLFIAAIFLCAMMLWDFSMNRKKSKRVNLPTAKKGKAKGVIFGKKGSRLVYSPTAEEGHIVVFGGSGLGKTSALLIPTLRSWTGTAFVIDISGDISKNVDIENKLLYHPCSETTIPYNIFAAIDRMTDIDEQNEALEELAYLLLPEEPQATDASRFFTEEGRKIITAALLSFYHQGYDFCEIAEKVVCNSWQDLFTEIDNTQNRRARSYINSFEGANEKNTAGCKQEADAVLKLFALNKKIRESVRRPRDTEKYVAPEMLEHSSVFVIIEDSKLALFSPLLHVITAQCLDYFSARPNDAKTTILLALDEFASLGKLEIAAALRKYRKKHVRIMVLTQSLADIDLIYGTPERRALMNNFKFKVVLGADDNDTQNYFAQLIGYEWYEKKSTSQNSKNVTRTKSNERRLIQEPAELAHLGDKLILLYSGGHIKLRKNFYFKK